MSDFTINKKGFWESSDSSGHLYDEPLSHAIVKFLTIKNGQSVIDLGCGMADYTRALLKNGFECAAYDGNPNTVSLTGGIARVLDLSQPFELDKKYDWVLCLEVGEHIPKKFEKIFLDNVSRHAITGIILSWAIRGQGGDGHVNCRSNLYIVNQMKKRGCSYDVNSTNMLRNEATFGWFKNTLMVFRKEKNSKTLSEIIRSTFTKMKDKIFGTLTPYPRYKKCFLYFFSYKPIRGRV